MNLNSKYDDGVNDLVQTEVATIFIASGMTCPNCELRIKNKLKTIKGLISIKADYRKECVSLVYDLSNDKEAEILDAIQRLDYKVKSSGKQGTSLHNSKVSPK